MRIGAACKWLNSDGTPNREATFKTTTVKYLTTLSKIEREKYLHELVQHNVKALKLQIRLVGKQSPILRMWRLGSDLLPLRTHPSASAYYASDMASAYIRHHLQICGKLARLLRVRLSFHLGQFVVLGSKNPMVRDASLEELQYHCDVFSMMGYQGWHDRGTAVNIHVGLKEPNIKAIRSALQSSESIANFVTLENDEFSWGAQQIVDTFGDLVPVVLDVHHHWIETGTRLTADSTLAADIIKTWRGVKPKIHLAISEQDLCADVDTTSELNLQELLDCGKNRAKLRIHSQTAWHTPSLDYASSFLTQFDLMWEGKNKNLGALEIATYLGLTNGRRNH